MSSVASGVVQKVSVIDGNGRDDRGDPQGVVVLVGKVAP